MGIEDVTLHDDRADRTGERRPEDISTEVIPEAPAGPGPAPTRKLPAVAPAGADTEVLPAGPGAGAGSAPEGEPGADVEVAEPERPAGQQRDGRQATSAEALAAGAAAGDAGGDAGGDAAGDAGGEQAGAERAPRQADARAARQRAAAGRAAPREARGLEARAAREAKVRAAADARAARAAEARQARALAAADGAAAAQAGPEAGEQRSTEPAAPAGSPAAAGGREAAAGREAAERAATERAATERAAATRAQAARESARREAEVRAAAAAERARLARLEEGNPAFLSPGDLDETAWWVAGPGSPDPSRPGADTGAPSAAAQVAPSPEVAPPGPAAPRPAQPAVRRPATPPVRPTAQLAARRAGHAVPPAEHAPVPAAEQPVRRWTTASLLDPAVPLQPAHPRRDVPRGPAARALDRLARAAAWTRRSGSEQPVLLALLSAVVLILFVVFAMPRGAAPGGRTPQSRTPATLGASAVPRASTTPRASATASATGVTSGGPVGTLPARVASVDPSGGSGFRFERGSWTTQRYASPAFGNLKAGVGLLLDLRSARTVTTVTVRVGNGPLALELRAGDSAARAGKAYVRVDRKSAASGTVRFNAGKGGRHRYWLVWVTRLNPSSNTAVLGTPVAGGPAG